MQMSGIDFDRIENKLAVSYVGEIERKVVMTLSEKLMNIDIDENEFREKVNSIVYDIYVDLVITFADFLSQIQGCNCQLRRISFFKNKLSREGYIDTKVKEYCGISDCVSLDGENINYSYNLNIGELNLSTLIDKTLNTLTPKEEMVIRLRFIENDDKSNTLEQVGKNLGVGRERVRSIQEKGLRKLRHPSRSKPLKDFYFN